MKKIILGLGILILLVSIVRADLDLPRYNDNYYKPGVLAVKFKSKPILEQNQAEKLFQITFGDEVLTSKTGTPIFKPQKQKGRHFVENIYVFEYDKKKDIGAVIKQIKKDYNVQWVEPDFMGELLSIPNDPYYPQQWNFPKTSAPEGWDIEKGSEDIIIATVDTGIDWKHPDLVDKIRQNLGEDADYDGHVIEWNGTEWIFDSGDLNGIDDDGNAATYLGYEFNGIDDLIGYDFILDNEDNDPMDTHGHGTFQYGLISASTENSLGIAGLCWNCNVMGLRAGVDAMYSFPTARATLYATDNSVKAINYAFKGQDSSFLHSAVQYAYANGVFIASAAGNDNNDIPIYPAAWEEVMAVGGTDQNDNRYSSSSYGSWVEVSAPAVSLTSTWKDNAYASGKQGTSYAAPQVTGLAGLILSKNPTLTNEQVRQIIKDSADNITTDHPIGGRINVSRALQMTPSLNTYLAGKIRLGLRPSNHSELLNVSLKNLQNSNINSYTVTSDYDGYFAINDLEAVSYDIWVKPYHFLAVRINNTQISSLIDFGTAKGGDLANNDNDINFRDIGPFSNSYGSNSTSPLYNPWSDANLDGKVNALDIAPFSANYGSKGAPILS